MSEKQNYSTVTFNPDRELQKKLTSFAAANGFTVDEAIMLILKEQLGKGE